MTIEIKLTLEGVTKVEFDQHMAVLGFTREATAPSFGQGPAGPAPSQWVEANAEQRDTVAEAPAQAEYASKPAAEAKEPSRRASRPSRSATSRKPEAEIEADAPPVPPRREAAAATDADTAQDNADEAAEAAADAPAALGRDDLRAAMQAYVNRYGLPAAQEDGSRIFGVLGTPPEGETVWKLSNVPDDKLTEAVGAWNDAREQNPFGRKAGGA